MLSSPLNFLWANQARDRRTNRNSSRDEIMCGFCVCLCVCVCVCVCMCECERVRRRDRSEENGKHCAKQGNRAQQNDRMQTKKSPPSIIQEEQSISLPPASQMVSLQTPDHPTLSASPTSPCAVFSYRWRAGFDTHLCASSGKDNTKTALRQWPTSEYTHAVSWQLVLGTFSLQEKLINSSVHCEVKGD